MGRLKNFIISLVYLSIWYLVLGSLCLGQSPDPAPFSGLFFSGNHIPPASPYRTNPAHKLIVKTKLQLTHARPVNLQGNYSLSFRASFWADFSHGNIFKVENAGYTLKFNFNHHPDSAFVFLSLAINSEATPVSFPLMRSDIYDGRWYDILIEVDEANGILAGKVNGVTRSFRTKPFLWTKESHISFGADGPTQDCAAMILKDLKLSINGVLEHRWLFTEMEGSTAYDAVGDLDARVTEHDWLINRHFKPAEKDSFFIPSGDPVSFFVDKARKTVVIRLPESIKFYDLSLRTFSDLSSLPSDRATEDWQETVSWRSGRFEFEDSASQLKYSLQQYPRKDGVLIRIFTQRLPLLSAKEHEELLELSPNRMRARERDFRLWASVAGGLILLTLSGLAVWKYSKKRVGQQRETDEPSPKVTLCKEFPKTNYISIFGGLKLIDKNGINHSDKLPRQLREIVAMIAYHSRKHLIDSHNGVGFKLLEEVFWYDIKSENLKNNRNVAFTNIRKAIKDFEGLVLTTINNRVTLEYQGVTSNRIDEFFDLLEVLEDSNTPTNEKALASFAGIVSEGIALADLHSEWAENTRSILRSKVISVLEKYQILLFERGDFASCVKIANIALLHDPLHEVTLKYLLRAYFALGKAPEAERFYRNFCEQYFDVFKEEFPFELEELLQE